MLVRYPTCGNAVRTLLNDAHTLSLLSQLQVITEAVTAFRQYVQVFNDLPTPLEIGREMVLPQLRKVRGESMLQIAFKTVGPNLRGLMSGGTFRGVDIRGITENMSAVKGVLSEKAIPGVRTAAATTTAAVCAANAMVTEIDSADIQAHLETVLLDAPREDGRQQLKDHLESYNHIQNWPKHLVEWARSENCTAPLHII